MAMTAAQKAAQRRYRAKLEVKRRRVKENQRYRQTKNGRAKQRAYEVSPERRAYKTQKQNEYNRAARPIPYREMQSRLKKLGANIRLNSTYEKLYEELQRLDP